MFNKFWKAIVNLDLLIAGIALVTLVAITFMGVIARYFLNDPFQWLEEVQCWLFMWITFFGGSAAFRKKSHVEIEMLVEKFPQSVQKIIGILVYAVVVFVLCDLFLKGNQLVSQYIQTNSVTSVLHISSPFIYLAVPVGCVLMVLNYSAVTLRDLFFRKNDSEEEKNS